MNDNNWNPWKLTAIGLALVMVTAVVTGINVRPFCDISPVEASRLRVGSTALPLRFAPRRRLKPSGWFTSG